VSPAVSTTGIDNNGVSPWCVTFDMLAFVAIAQSKLKLSLIH